MPAVYLEDCARELREAGEAAFRRRHRVPVLVVTGQVARGERAGPAEITNLTAARPAGRGRAALALMHRVFRVARSAGTRGGGPITLGRTEANDVRIPEQSISKRHCVFEVRDGGLAIRDLGSTNGTSVDGTAVE